MRLSKVRIGNSKVIKDWEIDLNPGVDSVKVTNGEGSNPKEVIEGNFLDNRVKYIIDRDKADGY